MDETNTVLDLILDALHTDGGHHKQWYLEVIAKLLIGEITLEAIRASELGDWTPGIAP